MIGQFLAEQAVDHRRLLVAAAVFDGGEFRPSAACAEIADHAGRNDDDREGDVEKEDRDKGDRGERDHQPVAQRALADADDGLDHDREHRGLQAEEHRLDEADIAIGRVDVAQAHDGDDAGQDEQAAGHDAAGGPVQQPADIGRELLRFRPRQQHAVVQRMQKPALRDPVLFLDQDAVHHRDLPGRAAETQHGDPQPDPEGFTEADAVTEVAGGTGLGRLVDRGIHYGFALLVGQLCVSPDASRHQR